MEDTRWLDERESRAWRGFQQLLMQVDGELARRLTAESNLSYSDYAVLVVLTDQTDGRVRSFELCALLGWEKSRLSHHLSRMERRGLITKEACGEDRRGAHVVATEKGRLEIEAAAPAHVEAVRELFIDHLDERQLDALADVAETVLGALAAET